MGQDVLILGIESSCDETAASVVRNGSSKIFAAEVNTGGYEKKSVN